MIFLLLGRRETGVRQVYMTRKSDRNKIELYREIREGECLPRSTRATLANDVKICLGCACLGGVEGTVMTGK